MTRMILKAYVHEGGAIRVGDEGLSEFRSIYANAPDHCRYVVTHVATEYWVLDLWNSHISVETYRVKEGPHQVFKDLDAAIMATLLNYKSEHMHVVQRAKQTWHGFVRQVLKSDDSFC